MKSPLERGPYGRWLVASRMKRNLRTAEDARQALAAAGIHIGKSTYAEYESGTKPISKNHLPLLERFFGPFADPEPEGPGSDYSDLIAAIRDQTEMLRAVLFTLAGRTLSAENQEWAREMHRAMSTGTPLPIPAPQNDTAR